MTFIKLFILRLFFVCFMYPFYCGYFRGKKAYEPPRYMTINTAIEQLLEIVQDREECGEFLSIYTSSFDKFQL